MWEGLLGGLPGPLAGPSTDIAVAGVTAVAPETLLSPGEGGVGLSRHTGASGAVLPHRPACRGSPIAPAELLGQRLGVAAFSPGWRSPATTLLHPWAGGPSERTVQTRESEHVQGGSRVFPNFCPVSALAPGKGFLTDVGNSSCRGSCRFSL